MNNFAIVVVGYNRIPGMLRLLNSLENAEYGSDKITLIVSLDNSGDDSVVESAKAFEWTHGKKIVRTFPTRQGLRNHILSCGDYLKDYDAIAVFEDDIIASPGYYNYMKQVVDFYKNDDNIAGISLYSHKINVNANLPFMPQPSNIDVFLLQFAQSWGQIWIRDQWFAFKQWYIENNEKPIEADNVPEYVSGWPKTSWLKYHIKYCIDSGKYFVYPYESLATCFSDVGEHCKVSNSRFQVPILQNSTRNYRFSHSLEELMVYDAFFERKGLGSYLGVSNEDICIDLYGKKENREGKRYLLAKSGKPYKVIKTFALQMRPQEANVVFDVSGGDIVLYDTTETEDNILECIPDYKEMDYYFNITAGWKKMARYMATRIAMKVKR